MIASTCLKPSWGLSKGYNFCSSTSCKNCFLPILLVLIGWLSVIVSDFKIMKNKKFVISVILEVFIASELWKKWSFHKLYKVTPAKMHIKCP